MSLKRFVVHGPDGNAGSGFFRQIQDLLRQADEAIYTADTYSRWCMFQRDRYLVDHSAYCLCYWNRAQGERGGTAYTVGYARKRGLEVENLGDFPLLNR